MPYTDPRRLLLLTSSCFVELGSFKDWLNSLTTTPVHYKQKRDEVRQYLRILQTQTAPFSLTRRFPQDAFYVLIDDEALSHLLNEISDFLQFTTSEDKDRNTVFESLRIKAFSALRELRSIINPGNDFQILAENGVFDRHSFETFYKLTWINDK